MFTTTTTTTPTTTTRSCFADCSYRRFRLCNCSWYWDRLLKHRRLRLHCLRGTELSWRRFGCTDETWWRLGRTDLGRLGKLALRRPHCVVDANLVRRLDQSSQRPRYNCYVSKWRQLTRFGRSVVLGRSNWFRLLWLQLGGRHCFAFACRRLCFGRFRRFAFVKGEELLDVCSNLLLGRFILVGV